MIFTWKNIADFVELIRIRGSKLSCEFSPVFPLKFVATSLPEMWPWTQMYGQKLND